MMKWLDRISPAGQYFLTTMLLALGWITIPAGAAEVPVRIDTGEITIDGSLHQISDNGDPAPLAIIMVGGSGARTRADTAPAVGVFQQYGADVLVYDRRGNGQSGNGKDGRQYQIPDTENTATLIPIFSEDVAALAKHLKEGPHKYQKVVLAGSSMGAWIVVRTGARSKHVDGVISLSGATSSVGLSDYFDELTNDGLSIERAYQLLPSYKGVKGYDPGQDLVDIAIPALWIYGGMDDSNPTRVDVANIEKVRAQYGKEFEVAVFDRANHDLINVDTREMEMGWLATIAPWLATKVR